MEQLFDQERELRLTKDDEAMKSVFARMLSICNDDSEVLSLMRTLSRRKSQLKPALSWLINHVFESRRERFAQSSQGVDEVASFVGFCSTLLREVVEGKMFLEKERVMLSSTLKEVYIRMGEMKKALDAVFGVPVETFTSIEEREAIAFQLEQLRLAVVNEDWVKADICSKKIRKRYFLEKKDHEQEIKYNKHMVDLYLGQGNYIEASKCLLEISNSVDTSANVVLSSFFAIISLKTEERDRMVKTLTLNKSNTESIRRTLTLFLKDEIIQQSAMDVFKEHPGIDLGRYTESIERAVDSHNLCVISKFCTLVSINDVSCLLRCKPEDVTEKVCWTVNKRLLSCKIDQEKEMVVFNVSLEPNWIREMDIVLNKVMNATHLIHNENVKHALKDK